MRTLFKLLLATMVISFVLSSCADVKPDDTMNKPGISTNNHQHYIPVYDPQGKIIGQKAVPDTVMYLKIKYGQAVHYAKKSGYALQQVLAWVMVGVAALILILLAIGKWEMGRGPGILLLACFASFLGFNYGKPSAVWWNNDGHEISVSRYDSTLAQFGSSQPLWDSIYNANGMNWAASKK